ncbi:glucose PTS transporter subunit IIA [Clostridium butyricum]|uniref:glucose PTS transporter subunit IIA n=1 Tax=Clostridium butyricum TaxID=1492 RepID=UPI001FACFB3C|nr:glucose PTS transporter subunit IIA [Clostridium butyricum]MDB2151463.1 glucose PTS transporter subunit IIA [Clostridium butyricum]
MIVSIRTKDKKTKQIATSTGITALMGITEPALYGVNLPKKYPLIASMIGGGFGGLYAGITHTHRFATGSSGLPAVLLYIGDDTMIYFYNILISIVITVVVTAVVTYILSLKYEKSEDEIQIKSEVKNFTISSPLKGSVIQLNEVKDEAFASELMGKGIAIEPSEGKVIAPFDGTIVSLFPTKHALGLLSNDGVELLIHVGVNTVELNGKYFEAHVEQGDIVKKGQTLITFNLEKIKEEGYITQVPIIVTNTPNYSDVVISKNENSNYNEEILVLKA